MIKIQIWKDMKWKVVLQSPLFILEVTADDISYMYL